MTPLSFGSVEGRYFSRELEHKTTLSKHWKQLCLENDSDATKACFDREKDRYTLHFVYEHSRVKLQPEDEYINANYLLNQQFIACQAPLPATFCSFWTMIWQENISLVVMLTKLEENQRCKADRYWPTTMCPRRRFFDEMDEELWVVEFVEKIMDDNIIIRKVDLSDATSGETRRVTQVQYTGWPDHGCPEDFESFILLLSFVYKYFSEMEEDQPTLVHCSAGVGRTGTFITIWYELMKASKLFRENAKLENQPHNLSDADKKSLLRNFLAGYQFTISDTVRELRKDRKIMVQQDEQFYFCYDIFRYLMENEDEHSCDDENSDSSDYCESSLATLFPLFFDTD